MRRLTALVFLVASSGVLPAEPAPAIAPSAPTPAPESSPPIASPDAPAAATNPSPAPAPTPPGAVETKPPAAPANSTAASSAPPTVSIPVDGKPNAFGPAPPQTPVDPNAETLSNRKLREVIERESEIWKRLRAHRDDEAEQQRAQSELRDIRTAYETILLANPKFAQGYAAYGLFLARVDDREHAVQSLVRANMLDSTIAPVKSQLGNFLFEDGKYREALGYFLAAVKLKPDEPIYHYQLGSVLAEYRRFFVADGVFTREELDQKIQEAFHRASELAPDEWKYTYRYAESFYDLDKPRWPEALAEWDRLEKLADPGLPRQTLALHRINILLILDRRDEARALLDTITEPALQANKQKLVDRLNAPPSQPPTPPIDKAPAPEEKLAPPTQPAVTEPSTQPAEPTPAVTTPTSNDTTKTEHSAPQ